MNTPLLTGAVSWDKYLENIFVVVRKALVILIAYPELPNDEDALGKKNTLNRTLQECIEEAVGQLGVQFSNHLPTYNSPNSEGKMPDFRWHMYDHAKGMKRIFDLECKRLGKSTEHTKLYKKYVKEGIMRFLLEDYRYGNNENTAGMVAYIQGTAFIEIMSGVNKTALECSVSPLTLSVEGWCENGVSVLEQSISRSFPVSPITVYHFWVDCRSVYKNG